ncbi:MAG: hypothetical protein ACRDHL_03175, partial [Candidatus Promineifilaceae bacterium]
LHGAEVMVGAQLAAGPPGLVVAAGDGAAVLAGDGGLRLLRLQLEGGRPLPIDAFLRGRPGLIGSLLDAAEGLPQPAAGTSQRPGAA